MPLDYVGEVVGGNSHKTHRQELPKEHRLDVAVRDARYGQDVVDAHYRIDESDFEHGTPK